MQFRKLFVASAALVLTGIAAQASAQAPDVGKLFNAWDSNRDGALTLTEWTAAGREEDGFHRVDADHDGKITLAELKTAVARMRSGG